MSDTPPASAATVAALEAERDALKLALEQARAAAASRKPEPPTGVVLERCRGQWALHLGEMADVEADLLARVVAEFLRARQLRIETGLPGATIVRADEGAALRRGGAQVRGSIEVHTPRQRTA